MLSVGVREVEEEIMGKFVVLLVFFFFAAEVKGRPDGSSNVDGASIEELKQQLNALELQSEQLGASLASVRNQCAVNQDRRANLLDRTVPFLLADNPRQNAAIDRLNAQLKALRHRVDEDQAQAAETAKTTVGIESSTDLMFGTTLILGQANFEQQPSLEQLDLLRLARKGEFLDDLNDNLTAVNVQLLQELLGAVAASIAVNDRKCEYGQTSLEPGERNITFSSKFVRVPTVSLQMSGFLFDLTPGSHGDRYDHRSDPDLLTLDKYVESTSTDGFTMKIVGEAEGSAKLIRATCTWAACQDL